MVLIDTSVWIEVFSKRAFDLEAQVERDQIVTCAPIVQEVLQGFSDERAHRLARDAMLSFPVVEDPSPLALYLEAADLYRIARRQGVTVRSSVDCLIAACALRHDLEVLHQDRDFAHLARVSRLRHRRIA